MCYYNYHSNSLSKGHALLVDTRKVYQWYETKTCFIRRIIFDSNTLYLIWLKLQLNTTIVLLVNCQWNTFDCACSNAQMTVTVQSKFFCGKLDFLIYFSAPFLGLNYSRSSFVIHNQLILIFVVIFLSYFQHKYLLVSFFSQYILITVHRDCFFNNSLNFHLYCMFCKQTMLFQAQRTTSHTQQTLWICWITLALFVLHNSLVYQEVQPYSAIFPWSMAARMLSFCFPEGRNMSRDVELISYTCVALWAPQTVGVYLIGFFALDLQ